MKRHSLSLWPSESTWICCGCRSRLFRKSLHTAPTPPLGRARPGLKSHQEGEARHTGRQQRWLSVSPRCKAAPTRTARLPDGPARTRFAPSPTGYLHIGGLRTALFSYLLAKRTEGQFVLRIEDTDQKRLIHDAEARLCEDLHWAGLRWDEGPDTGGKYGPYKQSLRNELYQRHAHELLEADQAYRCFCTPQTAGEAKAAYVTSGCYQNCSSLSADESNEKAIDLKQHFTIRLRQPLDAHKRQYPDLIYGNIRRLKRSPSAPLTASEDDAALDAADTILVKSDGTPTYHFANVVDDRLMGISHVIRGSEWMASTPLHYDIYSAFDWTPPKFAHVGLLVDRNKAKLSKRNADLALDVASMREKHGVLPAPLVNFLALLGWSNPTNNDVMELDDMMRNFDLKFTRGNAMVRMEKLWFLQKAHVARQCERASKTGDLKLLRPVLEQVVASIQAVYQHPTVNKDLAVSSSDTLTDYATAILLADSKSFQNATQFVERNRYFFAYEPAQVPVEQDFYNKARTITPEHLQSILRQVLAQKWTSNSHDTKEEISTQAPHIAIEAKLHAILVRQVWNAVLNPLAGTALCEPPEELPSALSPERLAEKLRNIQIDASTAPDDVARCVTGPKATTTEVDVLVKRYKAVNGALMKFLREKLSLGLPGPHMNAVMSILGMGECARRIGIEVE